MKDSEQHDRHTGSSFKDFLDEEGIRNEVEAATIKRVLAWQFEQAMQQQQKTKQGMAKQLNTSRSQLERLLDPANTAVSLQTISRAADALGKTLVFELHDKTRKPSARKRKATALVTKPVTRRPALKSA